MDEKRPPDIDAEYRLIHGPWPRWALQLSLWKLALRTAGVVLGLVAASVVVAMLLLR